MNIQLEIKRVCTLNCYLELIKKCQQAIDVCEEKLQLDPFIFGVDFSKFYANRLIRQNELLKWLENRYTNTLIS